MLRNVGTTSLKLIQKVNLKLLVNYGGNKPPISNRQKVCSISFLTFDFRLAVLGALVCVSAPLIYAALFYLSKLTARIIWVRLF
jgi:hypothetical protein